MGAPAPVMQGTASPTGPGLRASPLQAFGLYLATGVSPSLYLFGNPCWRKAS